MLAVLPNPPTIKVNLTTGDIFFYSDDNGDVMLDFYQVTVTDITSQVIVNETLSNKVNQLSVHNLFQQPICSPYTVTVQAHNQFVSPLSEFFVNSEQGGINL